MSIKITFTIQGNQQNPHGNPIPFQRMLASQMRYASGRYVAWQSYVRNQFNHTAIISDEKNISVQVKDLKVAIISDVILETRSGPLTMEIVRKENARLAINLTQ